MRSSKISCFNYYIFSKYNIPALERNALRPVNTTAKRDAIPADRTLSSIEGTSGRYAPKQGAPQAPAIGRMVDIEAKKAEGKGVGYEKWAKLHNLKEWSKSFLYLQENGLLSPEQIEAAVDAAAAESREARSRYDEASAMVEDKKKLLEAMDNYRRTKPAVDAGRKLKGKKAEMYQRAYESDIIINEAAKRQLAELNAPNPLPKRKEIISEIQTLISEKNDCYNEYREKSGRLHELMTIQRNYQMAMQPQKHKKRSHEQER